MVNCSNCGNKIGRSSPRYILKEGQIVCYFCNKQELRRAWYKKTKEDKLMSECVAKIYKALEYIFNDKPEELEFAKQVIDIIIRDMDEFIVGCNPDYMTPLFGSMVGHKRRVINLLKEYNVLVVGVSDRNFSRTAMQLFGCKSDTTKEKALGVLLSNLENTKKKLRGLRQKKAGKRFICSSCEYKWESKKGFGEPAKCPKCNSKCIASFHTLNRLLNDEYSK